MVIEENNLDFRKITYSLKELLKFRKKITCVLKKILAFRKKLLTFKKIIWIFTVYSLNLLFKNISL